MLAHWHVARVGTSRVVFANVEYPEGNPPEVIRIDGTAFVREDVAGRCSGRCSGRCAKGRGRGVSGRGDH